MERRLRSLDGWLRRHRINLRTVPINLIVVVLYFTSGDEDGCRLNIRIFPRHQTLTVLTIWKALFDALSGDRLRTG
ncbi:hypothetical protein NDU88_009249 [Pleurodeles waltl]|uniref:Uncharacterized protein n=1 Tax=Pleurodeles waltl TaxID=8319 RepID=A0AAV7RZY7_PLEWA|nr:hypothetical protein NDU88_009249 [Pleurodeles waltl]